MWRYTTEHFRIHSTRWTTLRMFKSNDDVIDIGPLNGGVD